MELLLIILGLVLIVVVFDITKKSLTKRKKNKTIILEYPKLKNELSKLRKELIKKERHNSSLKDDNNSFKSQHRVLLNKLSELNEVNKRYSNDLLTSNERLEKKIIETNEKINEIEFANKTLRKLRDVNSEITQNNETNNELISKLKEQNDETNQENEKLVELKDENERQILFLKNNNRQINIEKDNYLNKFLSLERENESLINTITDKDKLFKSLQNKTDENISKITSLYSDFLFVQFDISKRMLEIKKQPARKEALRINELKKEYKHYFEQYKMMLYKYEYLLQLFPELSDYVDDFESIQKMNDITSLQDLKDDYDRVKNYISKFDYQNLDVDIRNQLALDNYIKSTKKSNWQIGRDYELMCGIEYQKNDWDVEYIGMEKKFQDMGRDLIAKKGNETHIVQCKRWNKKKIIHENHIAQLFGTTKAFGFDQLKLWDVKPVFITNIELSETAKMFAEILEIIIIKKEFSEFPRIKCNITKDKNGKLNKIYHLPFDQQYDRTQIKHDGEFYAYTVKEAVEKGFRRAFRYNPNNHN